MVAHVFLNSHCSARIHRLALAVNSVLLASTFLCPWLQLSGRFGCRGVSLYVLVTKSRRCKSFSVLFTYFSKDKQMSLIITAVWRTDASRFQLPSLARMPNWICQGRLKVLRRSTSERKFLTLLLIHKQKRHSRRLMTDQYMYWCMIPNVVTQKHTLKSTASVKSESKRKSKHLWLQHRRRYLRVNQICFIV